MNQLKARVARAMVESGQADLHTVARMLIEIKFPQTARILGDSVKVKKGVKKGVLTAVVYLAPFKLSVPYGGVNVCQNATPGCARNCLGHCSGRLAMSTSRNSQVWKTLYWHYLTCAFWCQVEREIRQHARKAKRLGLIPAIRFNGSSDIRVDYLAAAFPGVQFYDYTKNYALARAAAFDFDCVPTNYHLTFSLGETEASKRRAKEILRYGGNVAVVFRGPLPTTWNGVPVIDGDETDVRFQDPRGVVVGLSAKGKAKTDQTGFVQD